LARASLLDEVIDLGEDSGTIAIRDELLEDVQQRRADALIKSAMGSGSLPSAEVVESRLTLSPEDEYVGTDAQEAEEEAVLDCLLEPGVEEDEDAKAAVQTVRSRGNRKAPAAKVHPIDIQHVFEMRVTEWTAAFAEAMSALRRLREVAGTPIGQNRELSLVRESQTVVLDDGSSHTEHKVMFVNWKAGQVGKVGQEVKDDCDGYLIFPMPVHYPFKKLESSVSILCPTVAVRIKKASQDVGRAKFPQFALRLRNMFAALDHVDVFATCKLCGAAHAESSSTRASRSSGAHAAQDAVGNIEAASVFTCAVCLIPFHRSCSERLARRCLSESEKYLPKQDVAELPSEFMKASTVCDLCLEAISPRRCRSNSKPSCHHICSCNILGLCTYRAIDDSILPCSMFSLC
jgi:hypothetical protein